MAVREITFDPNQANVLVPTQHLQQVSPWHAARTSVVVVNPDPNFGDVFKVGSRWNEQKKQAEDIFSLAKPALMKIAAAAGIVWNWRESGPEVLQRDYVCYKAVGAVRLPDGSWQPLMARKEIDLAVIEEELRQQYAAKAEGPCNDAAKTYRGEWRKYKDASGTERNGYFLADDEKPRYIEACLRANLVQWRKNKLMRAETSAMLRVVRAALGMKSQYTKEELQKPFIVPRIDFSPDYNDPAVRQALIEHGVKAMANLFGQSSPVSALGVPAPFSERPALTGDLYLEEPQEMMGIEPDEEPQTDDLPADSSVDPQENISEEETQMPQSVFVDPSVFNKEGQGTLFPEPPEPKQKPAPAPAPAADKKSPAAYCQGCGAEITEKVLQYSQQKFGKPLCYKCQKNGGESA